MLIKRLQGLTKGYSFFLFGPRGCGKSTLLEQQLELGNRI
jgi:predicted AAA+ superfamily ATPase